MINKCFLEKWNIFNCVFNIVFWFIFKIVNKDSVKMNIVVKKFVIV